MSRLKHNESVTHVMSRELQTIHTKTPLSEVGRIFANSEFHHLPVVENERLIGILSYTDLMRVSFASDLVTSGNGHAFDVLDSTGSVDQVMSTNLTTIQSTGTIREAAEILAQGRFHSLPVVDDGNLVGMVTSVDLLKYLLDQY